MALSYSLALMEAEIKHASRDLFTTGPLARQTDMAARLRAKHGLNLFATSVPWCITPQNGPAVCGFSETLGNAANDIHAQLVTLAHKLPADTPVTIDITPRKG